MKLYTEEQVKMMLVKAKIFDGNVSDNFLFIMSEDEIINSETPIELPSDEGIDEAIFPHMELNIKVGFIEGAKYIINKIQLGNK